VLDLGLEEDLWNQDIEVQDGTRGELYTYAQLLPLRLGSKSYDKFTALVLERLRHQKPFKFLPNSIKNLCSLQDPE
jgi:hypothetical protein